MVTQAIPRLNPSTRTEKGPVGLRAIARNQLSFAAISSSYPWPDAELQPRATWFLLHSADLKRGEVRVELSLAGGTTDGGIVDSWLERIILGTIEVVEMPTHMRAQKDVTPSDEIVINVEGCRGNMGNLFNSSRLELARRRRGLTKSSLANEAGISLRSLNAYELGDRQPTSETVVRLAASLDFEPAFFFGDDLDMPPVEGTSFRALTTLTARQRDQALGSAALGVLFFDWLSKRFVLPELEIPPFDPKAPELAANALRAEWGLGEQPVRNMIHLLEAHGIRVLSLVEECRASRCVLLLAR